LASIHSYSMAQAMSDDRQARSRLMVDADTPSIRRLAYLPAAISTGSDLPRKPRSPPAHLRGGIRAVKPKNDKP
jgi:hypothetical protein